MPCVACKCAWVLWSPVYSESGARHEPPLALSGRYDVAGSYDSRQRCEGTPLFKKGVGALCLPDTVDPRGPKGK